MQGSDKDCKDALRREVALFRYGVIAEILRLPRGSPERAALIRARARREWGIPGSSRRRVAETTIRDWLALHEDGGFDALFPKRRRDRGQSRGISAAAQEVLVRLKQDRPHLSVRRLLAAAAASGALPAGERPARSSADRLLRHEGLPGRDAQSPGGKDRRSFGYES